MKSNLQKAFIKPVDVTYSSANQFVNAQLADNINYYSYHDALNNHGKENELNYIQQQFNSTQDLEKVGIRRKHYHFHKTTNSISKISYR